MHKDIMNKYEEVYTRYKQDKQAQENKQVKSKGIDTKNYSGLATTLESKRHLILSYETPLNHFFFNRYRRNLKHRVDTMPFYQVVALQ